MSPVILFLLLGLMVLGLYLIRFGVRLNRRHEPVVPHATPRARSRDSDDEVISISLFLSELERSHQSSQQR